MIAITLIMVLAFVFAIVEMSVANWSLCVLLIILACVCWAGMAVVDQLKKQEKRNEELWAQLYSELLKLRRTLKKKDEE